jgi:hypothetical protein
MRYFVAAGKHVNHIRAIARQQPITTIEGLLEAVFSVESAPRLYSEDPGPAEESIEGGQLSRALQWRRRRDGATVELTIDKSSFLWDIRRTVTT